MSGWSRKEGVREGIQEGGGLRGGQGVLTNAVLVRDFSHLTSWRGDMEQKLHFQDNIGMWVYIKMLILKKDPLLSSTVSNLTTWRGDMGQNLLFFKIT